MPRSKAVVFSLCLAACCLSPCTLAAAPKGGKPLVTAITKDAATKLYTAPLKDSRPLVLDLSGPLICYHPPDCPHTGYGKPDEEDRFRCKCTAHPYNPFAGKSATGDLTRTTLSANATDGKNPMHPCTAHPYNPFAGKSATGDLTRTALSANGTDGKNPLRPVSLTAVASCAPPSHLAKLPAGAVGVAGLAASRVALPAQVARTQGVASRFMLCLPRTGAGVAIFGGGPLFLMTSTSPPAEVGVDLATLTRTPLLSKRGSSSYYLPVKAIAVDKARLQLPLATGGVVLSTRAPYTALRPDVYRPLVDAFDKALTAKWNSRKLCYDSKTLPGPTLIGWLIPDIDLMLEGGKNWTFIAGSNTMVDVNNFTAACFGFVEMKPEKGGFGGAPAMEIGGFQMENHVLQFDLEKDSGIGLLYWILDAHRPRSELSPAMFNLSRI
ncbi:basic 7S globulin 2-like [Panicum miliaceum]|uniref:Basic 7S globulin 2-like n=1 Tax=Panicum miliaceum TaxID=4540 RepID=A0A3L6SPJ4_PANMI|nr:basic 7S globulin 2-like [Panicum miliaceum]